MEILVGKTLEQALQEVMEEEELSALRAHQLHYEQVRTSAQGWDLATVSIEYFGILPERGECRCVGE